MQINPLLFSSRAYIQQSDQLFSGLAARHDSKARALVLARLVHQLLIADAPVWLLEEVIKWI
jgi:hypothetical protein